MGLANTAVTIEDEWSVKNNPGAFSFLEKTTASIQYSNRFLVSELSNQNLCFGYHTNTGNIGVYIQQSGFKLFRQIQVGGTYAMKLSKRFGLGININYHSTQFGDIYGQKSNMSAGIGMKYKLNDDIQFGASVLNINRSKLSDFEDERLPSVFIIGGVYHVTKQISWLLELQKDFNTSVRIKSGLEIKANDIFEIRLGINSYPFQSAFGFGIILKQFRIDMASIWHSKLGLSPTIGLVYQFK